MIVKVSNVRREESEVVTLRCTITRRASGGSKRANENGLLRSAVRTTLPLPMFCVQRWQALVESMLRIHPLHRTSKLVGSSLLTLAD